MLKGNIKSMSKDFFSPHCILNYYKCINIKKKILALKMHVFISNEKLFAIGQTFLIFSPQISPSVPRWSWLQSPEAQFTPFCYPRSTSQRFPTAV